MINKLEEIARPYAHAAFEFANEGNNLSQWAEMLQILALICADPVISKALSSPYYNTAAKKTLILDMAGEFIDQHVKNFVHVLAENGRLQVMTEIFRQYHVLQDAAKNMIEVEVCSARELSPAHVSLLQNALEKRTKAKIQLHQRIDPTLLGGIQLRLGDEVIDGSILSKLRRLALHLQLKENVCQ
ncbi:MAG: F0F1 ATP synthase subunit delta [Legionellales bacterium]|nr:F0F1 ATP synthase subunit delta [Legionellales bacterium]